MNSCPAYFPFLKPCENADEMFGKFALMAQNTHTRAQTHTLGFLLFPPLFIFLPEINNSQNTLARFYIVSNTDEVLPPAMSE